MSYWVISTALSHKTSRRWNRRGWIQWSTWKKPERYSTWTGCSDRTGRRTHRCQETRQKPPGLGEQSQRIGGHRTRKRLLRLCSDNNCAGKIWKDRTNAGLGNRSRRHMQGRDQLKLLMDLLKQCEVRHWKEQWLFCYKLELCSLVSWVERGRGGRSFNVSTVFL